MRKTALSIDDGKIAAAKAILGTTGITDTLDAALTDVIARHAALRHLKRLASGEGIDLDDAEIMSGAWH